MRPLIHEIDSRHSPESLVEQLRREHGVVLLRSGFFDSPQARFSFVAARPFLTFRSFGSRCELHSRQNSHVQFGNPWHLLDGLMARYELLDEVDLPFPLGGCFGYWGYDLKNFVEPKLARRAVDDLELPDCHVGFYDSLVVFDHHLQKRWIISTGLDAAGSRSEQRAREQADFWSEKFHGEEPNTGSTDTAEELPARFRLHPNLSIRESRKHDPAPGQSIPAGNERVGTFLQLLGQSAVPGEGRSVGRLSSVLSNFSRADFISAIERAHRYIRAGDIYQINLSQRLAAPWPLSGVEFFQRLAAVSPAPFSAYLDCGDFQIASSSPELFLRLSGPHIRTRPIKGTRPRSDDPALDARLACELQTSAKEMAELVMITDLLRNDLGKVCEYGSVQVPELARLERYPQVQHLVSTVEGRLRPNVTHFAAFASCFPGGSITGAPKIRAMEIIDELEPNTRGPYTGALGYLGFNRESQVSILIRAAICRNAAVCFQVGAGIVADSVPEAEYEETLVKARGFFSALNLQSQSACAFLTT